MGVVFSWFWVSETTYPYVLLEDFGWSLSKRKPNLDMILLLKNGICWTNSPKASDTFEEEWKKLRIRS